MCFTCSWSEKVLKTTLISWVFWIKHPALGINSVCPSTFLHLSKPTNQMEEEKKASKPNTCSKQMENTQVKNAVIKGLLCILVFCEKLKSFCGSESTISEAELSCFISLKLPVCRIC